jgi:hypothetical protein
MLQSNKSTGHAIAFPSDGPVKLAKVLPVLYQRPKIKFLGPEEKWHTIYKHYQHLYDIDIPGAFAWLEVFCGLRQSSI